VIDGVHFDARTARPEEIGRKALGRCLSDVAAMAGVPTFAVAAMMVPRGTTERFLRRVYLGMERLAREFDTAIVGGDFASHPGRLALTVALLGEVRGAEPVRRNGARPGDAVAVTGALGGSILGKHLRFTPRVREAQALAARFTLHSMIDVSDGLGVDLGHLCEESGVRAVVYERRVPLAPAARKIARKDGRSPLAHAIGDGEDYELLFTLPAGEAERLERTGLGRVIGEIVRGRGMVLARRDGRREPLRAAGWEHRTGGP
jgi:thiamine-monophosphate kinase